MNLPSHCGPSGSISRRVDVRAAPSLRGGFRPNFSKTKTRLSRTKLATFDAQVEARAKAALGKLAIGTKRKLDALAGYSKDGPVDDDGAAGWVDDDDDDALDEGIEISAEGGEAEFLQEYICKPPRKATQTWVSRISKAGFNWAEQLEALVDAYLAYKHDRIDVQTLQSDTYELPYIDVFDSNEEKVFYQIPGSPYPNTTLLAQGALGPTPARVYIAFSLRTLELYRRVRIRQPRVSIQAWLRVIADMHDRPYRRALWQQFTEAFDVYLMILRRVQDRLNSALGRSTPDWRVKHSCPPCQYQLVDEPLLEVSVMGAFDGNSSLKRIKLRANLEADPRQFLSDYYLSESEVDVYKDAVKARPSPRDPKKQAHDQPEEASVVAGDEDDSVCAHRWKAAMSDSHKKMWDIYRETGIFLSACRHGLIWWMCDMVRSGELAKYPLAIVARIIRTFVECVGLGYDVACQFLKTIAKSPLAGAAAAARLRMVVNAFHGWAHNRACQLSYHPLYVTGFGIEDLETCERIFSSSNGLASITRYASQFHRHQAIDMWAGAWDDDKYQELSAFMLNNYKQAGQILEELPSAVRMLQTGRSIEDTDYHKHLEAERLYLAERRVGTPEESWRQHYVALLKRYAEACRVFDKASQVEATPISNQAARDMTHRVKLQAFELLEQVRTMLHEFENHHQIERWTTDSPEYVSASEDNDVRLYRKALDKLEGLVVQRLFELAKLGISGTGYKMRMHINKSLKTRCQAIRTALRQYNTAASRIGRDQLAWEDVSKYGTLAEFELLRECRVDIRSKPWADARNRQAANDTLRIARAEEERKRLNIEVPRLAAWIRDEENDIAAAIRRLESDENHLLAAELRAFGTRRRRVNDIHRVRIQQIYRLPYFTGDQTIGVALERQGDEPMEESGGSLAPNTPADDEEGLDADEDDNVAEELHALSTFIEELSLVPDLNSSEDF